MISLLPGAAGAAQDWDMAGKDAGHSSAIEAGPSPPLRRAWLAKSGDPKSSFTTWPLVEGGVVYARSGPGVLAVQAGSGRRIWWHRNPEGSKQVAPAADEGRLLVLLPLGRAEALDVESGAELWRFQGGKGSLLDPSPTLAEGRLYFGLAEDRAFYAVDASEGHLVWKVATELLPSSAPTVGQEIVAFSTEDLRSTRNLILALDSATGREVWRTEVKEENSAPSLLGDRVIFGGGDFFAHALELATGKEIWRSPVEGKFGPRNMPAIAFGDVFLADRIGNIYRLDGKTGRRKWIFRDTEGTMDQSFPVIAGRTLFIGSSAGNLYALDTDSGRLLWKDHVNGIVLSGAADAEHFYFGVKFGDEGLYAYEHDPNGRLIGEPRFSAPLWIGAAILLVLLAVGVIVFIRRRRGAPDGSAITPGAG